MIQLRSLSDSGGAEVWEVAQFPFVIGRAASCDLRLEQPGVWDQHLRIELQSEAGFALSVLPGALVSINGAPVEAASALRSGDVIQFGAMRLLFTFTPTRQQSFRAREALTWLSLLGLSAAQVALIYRLLH